MKVATKKKRKRFVTTEPKNENKKRTTGYYLLAEEKAKKPKNAGTARPRNLNNSGMLSTPNQNISIQANEHLRMSSMVG